MGDVPTVSEIESTFNEDTVKRELGTCVIEVLDKYNLSSLCGHWKSLDIC